MLTGMKPRPLSTIEYYKERDYSDVISGNLFDGDMTFSMNGFLDYTTVNRNGQLLLFGK